jgi:hypothetical protein
MHSQHQIGRSDVQGNTRNERGGAPVTSYRVLREITIRNASFLSADRSETPNGWRFLSTIDKCLPVAVSSPIQSMTRVCMLATDLDIEFSHLPARSSNSIGRDG